MSRFAAVVVASLGLALTMGTAASAQPPIIIKDVRVGFPNGPQNDLYKSGCWAPVLVRIGPPVDRRGMAILPADFTGELRVSTSDGDGARTRFTPRAISIKREEIAAGQTDRTFLTYLKIGAKTNDIHVEVDNARVGAQAIAVRPLNYPGDLTNRDNGLPDQAPTLVLSVGRAAGLDPRPSPDGDPERGDPRGFRLATVNQLEELPEFWFGYESVDVLVLPTGGAWSGSLAQALAADQQRRVAVQEWVAQGGHLVIAVGANANIVASAQSFPLAQMLPAQIDPAATIKRTQLENLRVYVDNNVQPALRQKPREPVKSLGSELTRLAPRGAGFVLVNEPSAQAPAIVAGSYGLGRITVIGFDIDRGSFSLWENKEDFWTALLGFKSIRQAARNVYNYERNATLSEQLGNELERFGDVAVVSFFWVAIFILIYVIIIGPVDYFFLKKVVKRLELTWITFPAMVLLVSLAAYFGAYYLKGDELRLNKVDVVDIDQTNGIAVGTTWFSVFSPRLQSYDFALEPIGLGKPRAAAALAWYARAGYAFRGIERRQSDFFQREYLLADNGAALRDVPIQVWAMKTFAGRWQTELEGQTPILSTLRGQNNLLSGTLTSRLPKELTQVSLIYKNNLYPVGTLRPGERFTLESQNHSLSRNATLLAAENRVGASGQPLANFAATVGRIMFFRYFVQEATGESNELLGYLDQSWRLNGEEAILIGAYEDASGDAVELNQAAGLGAKLQSPQLRGTLRQCTYVRVYLPVRAAAAR
jgi:hypothetical protein